MRWGDCEIGIYVCMYVCMSLCMIGEGYVGYHDVHVCEMYPEVTCWQESCFIDM